jgi:hypothetical protein
VHIGAMNKLVVGAITPEQVRQFWAQTRVGAGAKLQRFAAAHARYDRRHAHCPDPGPAARAKPALTTCHRAVAARDRELDLAATTLGTWEQHLHHMEMLRDGEMTVEQAIQVWLGSWTEADREIRAYRAASRSATGLSC